LLSVVTMADRHRVEQFRLFAERVEINRHAERRAGLVLARVTLADGTAIVINRLQVRAAAVRGRLAPWPPVPVCF
jgi:hypothetical protein